MTGTISHRCSQSSPRSTSSSQCWNVSRVVIQNWWCARSGDWQHWRCLFWFNQTMDECPSGKACPQTSKALIVGLHCQAIESLFGSAYNSSCDLDFQQHWYHFISSHITIYIHMYLITVNIDFEFKSTWLLLDWCSNVFPPHETPRTVPCNKEWCSLWWLSCAKLQRWMS